MENCFQQESFPVVMLPVSLKTDMDTFGLERLMVLTDLTGIVFITIDTVAVILPVSRKMKYAHCSALNLI